MTDASPIASPCILVCQIEPGTGLCWGCGRTVSEIGAWSMLPPERRDAVMGELGARMARLPERQRRPNRRRGRPRDPDAAE